MATTKQTIKQKQQTAKQSYICHLHQQCQILQLQSLWVNCTSMTSLGQSTKGSESSQDNALKTYRESGPSMMVVGYCDKL